MRNTLGERSPCTLLLKTGFRARTRASSREMHRTYLGAESRAAWSMTLMTVSWTFIIARQHHKADELEAFVGQPRIRASNYRSGPGMKEQQGSRARCQEVEQGRMGPPWNCGAGPYEGVVVVQVLAWSHAPACTRMRYMART